MEKEWCHGCDKWFARIEQHLTYHNHCRSVMLEHARQQRLVVECRNRNNGMDPLIGTIVVASACEVDDGLLTCLPDAPSGNDASSKKMTTNPT
jgi:hypothetical protein